MVTSHVHYAVLRNRYVNAVANVLFFCRFGNGQIIEYFKQYK